MADTTIIRRARFAPGGDPLAARLKLDRELGAADWSVPSLPPSAILCVRRLRVRAREPGAVGAALKTLARRAARPAREFVPAAAEAVWFADTAEWLACLARDAMAGELVSRWWWDSVCRDTSGVRAASREWLVSSADAPAAWKLLTVWGSAQVFAAALEPAEAAALIREMAAAFRIRVPAGKVSPRSNAAEEVLTVREAAMLPPGPQRAALAFGLFLARSPHRARDGESIARLLTWAEFGADQTEHLIAIEQRASPQRAEGAIPRLMQEPNPPRNRSEESLVPDLIPAMQVSGVEPGEQGSPVRTSVVKAVVESAGESVSESGFPSDVIRDHSHETKPVQSTSAEKRSDALVRSVGATASDIRDPVLPTVARAARSVEAFPVPARVDTAFGGLLYLINVGLALDLYPDFTEPTRPGIALSLWDWLAILGRRWLGQAFLDDPLDVLLASLAGRSALQSPGTNTEPPNGWRLPQTWRAWMETPEPELWLTLADWLDWLAPIIARRLASALGDVGTDEVPRWLLQRRATIIMAPAHLDVMLPLAELAVEIRTALLDRDPGWIPAAGMTVRFHYESHG